MRKIALSIGAVSALLFAGCAFSNSSPVSGFIYTQAKATHGATANVLGSKRGQSCATSILGVVATGDASAEAAARAGGIKTISTVDSDNFGVLGVYAKNCTIVTGE